MKACSKIALCYVMCAPGSLPGLAQTAFPAKPLRLIVPFGPGGVGDISARTVAQKMGAAMGQQMITDNRPGTGGVVAAEMVAHAQPDG